MWLTLQGAVLRLQHASNDGSLFVLTAWTVHVYAVAEHMLTVAKEISIVKGRRIGGRAESMRKRGEEAQAGRDLGGMVSRAEEQIKAIQKLSWQMRKEQSWVWGH